MIEHEIIDNSLDEYSMIMLQTNANVLHTLTFSFPDFEHFFIFKDIKIWCYKFL